MLARTSLLRTLVIVICPHWTLWCSLTVNNVDGQTTLASTTSSSGQNQTTQVPAYTSTRRPITYPPFNQAAAIRKHVIENSKMHSPRVPPVEWFTEELHINTTIIINRLSRVEDVPHQVYVHSIICMKWYNIALVWSERPFNNVSTVPAFYWEVWSPQLIYYFRKYAPLSSQLSRFLTVDSNGICRWCSPATLVLHCERLDYRTNNCSTYLRFTGYPDARVKFGKVNIALAGRLNLPDLKMISFDFGRTYNKSTVPLMISDELTLVLKTSEGHKMDFALLTWPMLCVVVCLLVGGSPFGAAYDKHPGDAHGGTGHPAEAVVRCGYESRLFDLFSLKVWTGVLAAVFCCLSIADEYTVHPRLANAPYISWLLGLLSAIGVVLLVEASSPAVRSRLEDIGLGVRSPPTGSRYLCFVFLRVALVAAAVAAVVTMDF